MNDLDSLSALLTDEGRALLAELHDHDPSRELAIATRLRREHPAALVSAALGQARLRQRAAAKFGPEDAAVMFFTPDGVEQATRTPVAAHRAGRLAGLGVRRAADLCCGIGGDAIALARAGISVLAVDRSPLACAVAGANARALGLDGLIEVRCADVTQTRVSGCDAVFVDPARRAAGRGTARGASPAAGAAAEGTSAAGRRAEGASRRRPGEGGRIFDPEAYSPPLSWAVAAARSAPYAALKVAPGLPHEAIPGDAEAEWISYGGEVKEAVLWFGTSPGTRRATLLPGPRSLAGTGLPDPAPGPVGRWLYEPDGAVIRAHLVAEVAASVGGRLIDPTIAYVTSDEPHPTPYATGYEITDVLPFGLKRLKALLRERGVGRLTVKKRGSAVEPEEVRRRVKPQGPNAATVFLTRVAGAPSMLIGRPMAEAG